MQALAARLTTREVTVAGLVAQGLSSKRIARVLGISDLTVRKHRENVLRKLQLSDTTQIALCWPLIALDLQDKTVVDSRN